MRTLLKKYIGDKQFYKMVLAVAVPIMIQNGITNFVSLLDNIMVGQVGTTQMSGVSIANNLIFVYNVSLFGAISGAGIFTAQFYGNGNTEGVRHTFRFKLIICSILLAAAMLIFIFGGGSLISLYLQGEGTAQEIADTFYYGRRYLNIMLIGLVPYTIVQAYSSTLRECGETMMPMISGVVAVFVNLIFNYILIFGNFGAPKLGVEGAAIATVISRFVECGMIVLWTHTHTQKNPFIVAAYRSLCMPRKLAEEIIKKGSPLLANEVLWSIGMAILSQCYSYKGLDVVAGMNISSTLYNVCNVAFMAMGNAVAIIIGQLLGAGKMEEAVDKDRKLIFFAVAICFFFGAGMILIAPLFPMLYNTTQTVRDIAKGLIIVEALYMPINSFIHSSYFTMRSGGKTVITFLFDSVFVWVVTIPAAYILSRYTGVPIIPMYAICKGLDLIKCILGAVLLKKRVWVNNIVV